MPLIMKLFVEKCKHNTAYYTKLGRIFNGCISYTFLKSALKMIPLKENNILKIVIQFNSKFNWYVNNFCWLDNCRYTRH